MAVVTALRETRAGVVVELDGVRWRTLPLDAVVAAGLGVGLELDRERLRALVRARRRLRAEQVAVRALARREHSRASLDGRLARAGVPERERRDVVDRAQRTGLVDDARYAERRARHLADRGGGDRLMLDDLGRHGVAEDVARQAVARLEPEAERAARLAAARGVSRKTIRYLASRGFAEESLEALVAEVEGSAVA
jgi:regulatory protein